MAIEEVKLTSFKVGVEVDLDIDAVDIASKLDRLAIFQLIKELDDASGTWGLTCLLAKHFTSAMEKATAENLISVSLSGKTEDELVSYLQERDEADAEVAA